MKSLSVADASFLAGLFEGEGTFAGRLQGRGTVKICVCITNNDRRMLEWAEQITGLGKISPKLRVNPRWRPGFIWELSREDMRKLLPFLIPFLKFKQTQAELVLELLESLNKPGQPGLSREQRVLRSVICSELADLNKRGTDFVS